jgi:hypothetical protein
MPRFGLEDMSGIVDPLLSYNFSLIFPSIPNFGSDTRDLTIKCVSAGLPGMTIEQETIAAHGVEINYAGRQTWSKTFQATFWETRNADTRQAFRSWIEYARDNFNNQGNYKNGGNGYAVDTVLNLYDDIPQVINTAIVYGVFPTEMAEVQMDGAAGTVIQVQMTFSYDYTLESITGGPSAA